MLHYLKAHPLDKSKPKSRPSVRRSPLLRRLKPALFRSLQRQFNRNNLHHLPTLWRVLLSSQSDKIPKVELLIAIKDQARALHYLKAHPLDKSKPKRRPSVRPSPLLRLQLKPALFRLLQRQFNRNQLLHQPTLWRVLLSSQSDKIPKVELLIAIKDQARVPNYLKAHLLDKSQPKSWPSVRLSPLLRPFETRPFSIAAAASI